MSLRRLLPTTRNAEAARNPLENDRTPTYTSNNTIHTDSSVPGRDSVMLPDEIESSLTNSLGIAETSEVATPRIGPRYIYYRIYAEDGAIPSKTPAAPDDPFLGCIKARYVPPPHTVKAVKHSIAKVENIKDRKSTSLFLTAYSQSPMDDDGEVTILNRTGPGSTPQEPLALVAKMSDSERSALESGGRGGLASAQVGEPDIAPLEIRYLYYLFYADDYVMPSKVAIDPEEPSLGRIRADSVAPPHSPASIKRCISRVERTPELAHADLFAGISCKTPLKEGHISILHTDCPGLSPNEPMAIVLMPIVQVQSPSIPDGKYAIKNRAADIYWNAGFNPIKTVYFDAAVTLEQAKAPNSKWAQWHITNDTNGYISMTSPYAPSSWVGAEITGSTVSVPWRLIPAEGKYYYLTTDMNHVSQNIRVPTVPLAPQGMSNDPGSMATLHEGNQWQMWEFIRI